jgi:tetratricopeptide (TPR) repeat protein
MTGPSFPQVPAKAETAAPAEFRCQVCGKQDETLRLVAYPYVLSLVVVTYRRAFSGLWCLRHRLRTLGLAGVITAALGWVGIPFGFIFTPMTLWKLARGGELPAERNLAILKALAEQKLRTGDRRGAIRCVEAALSFGEDKEAEERLGSLASYDSSLFVAPPVQTALHFVGVICAALVLGVAVGVIDYLFVLVFSSLVGQEASIFLAILSWVPLVALSALVGLALFQLLERAIGQSRVVSTPPALGLSAFASLLAAYGILLGRAISDLTAFGLAGGVTLTSVQWFFMVGRALTIGGIWTLQDMVGNAEGAGPIYLGIVAAAALYFVLGSLDSARRTVRWQKRVGGVVQRVTNWRPASALPGWAAMGGMAVMAAVLTLFFSLPPAILTSNPDAFNHNQAGMNLLAAGDLQGAIRELEMATSLAPESAEFRTNLGVAYLNAGRLPEADGAFAEAIRLEANNSSAHMGRGYVHYLTGDLAEAEHELTISVNLAPSIPEGHYMLGSLSELIGDLDAAAASYEEAIRLDPSSTEVRIALARVDLARGEFETAISHAQEVLAIDPDSPDAYAILSLAHSRLGHLDLAQESRQTVERLASPSRASYTVVISFSDINDFDRAEAYLLQVGESLSWAGNYSLSLASLYSMEGRPEEALQAVEQAAALGADPVGVLQVRARLLVEMADLAGARERLSQASEVVPERSSVHEDLAWVLWFQGEVEAAEREARRAIEIGPYSASAHTVLALVLRTQGDLDSATHEAQEAVRLDPMRDIGHYALGLCYRSLGDEEQARAGFERFLELYWDRAYVRLYRIEVEGYLQEE